MEALKIKCEKCATEFEAAYDAYEFDCTSCGLKYNNRTGPARLNYIRYHLGLLEGDDDCLDPGESAYLGDVSFLMKMIELLTADVGQERILEVADQARN